MRVSTLILVLILGAFAFPRDAAAEKVKSNQETRLFARPGERAKVIAKVSTGKMMTVLAKEGRWLKVRVSGRTGYVARSTVDLPDEGEIARNTRRRSFVDGRGKSRGFGGEAGPDDRIGADAIGEGREDGGEDASEDEEEEDDPPAKTKPAAKTPPKAVAKSKKGSDDDEDEEDENPLPKAKAPAKAPTKVAAKEEDDEEEEDEDEDTRKRVKIKSKTTMYNEANTKSEAILVATKDTPLFPTGEKSGKFTEVENEEGDLGYVLTSDIEVGGAATKTASKDKDEDDGGELSDEADEPAVGGNRSRQIDVRVRAGVSFLTQGLRSPGGAAGPPNNYDISTAAMTVALGGGYYRPSGKKMILGIETNYDYAKALPGIKVPMGKTTSISLHNLNLRGVVGLDFHKPSGMMLLGRLGFRYSSFQVGNVKSMTENTALLPSEIIMAPMVGAALAMPRLSNKIGLRFSVDVMPLTLSYSQTKNLEDGKSPSARGAVVGVGFTYRWKSSMDIQATYDLTYQSAKFGDAVMTSARMHPMGGVTRSDLFHAVTVGIVKSF